ncbi:MAG TPA: sialidase family protein [Terriglobia bacterium]|nr:sialidase family protein [Terriglobia bacterium]
MSGTLAKSRKGEEKEEYILEATFYSMDLGQTWRQKEALEIQWTNKQGVVLPSNKALCIGQWRQLSDGSIMDIGGEGGNILDAMVRPEQAYRPWVSTVRRAKSPGELLKGNYVDDFAKIEIPNLAVIRGDSPNLTTGNACQVVEMENGDLILPMEGRFNNDLVRVPYHPWVAYQFRSWLSRSTDCGHSWYYLSTIASPAQHPLPTLSEGYCEPDVIRVDGAKLLAANRTGANPTGNGSTERYTALVASISRDSGVTWEPPREIYKYGVFPRLLKMSNGIIVCSSGRPGVFLLFSRDGGETWSKPYIVNDYHAAWGKCSSGYTSIGEIKPGVLCLFYDDVYTNAKGEISNLVKIAKYNVS